MRFFDIAIFIICLNIAVTIVGSTAIFPDLHPPQLFNVTTMGETAGNYGAINSSAAGADTSGFFAFIFAPLKAIELFVNLIFSVTAGTSVLVLWIFNCQTGTCPGYISLFAGFVASLIYIIYAIAIIQILSGRFVESN
jgi:hypothetical protein